MSFETCKALIADMVSSMSNDQLKNVIFNISNTNLEEVGKAILAEKGRKGMEVGKEEEKEHGKEIEKDTEKNLDIVKNVAPKIKTQKKAVPPRSDVGKGAVSVVVPNGKVKQLSKKRKYSVIDLSVDNLEHRDPVESLPCADQNADGPYEQINKACLRAMCQYIRGPNREKLQRAALVMNKLDWKRVTCRADLITFLSIGEIEECIEESKWDPKSMIISRDDMEEFVQNHYTRFEQHPMFVSAYGELDDDVVPDPRITLTPVTLPKTQSIPGTPLPSDARAIPNPFSRPPFNWNVISRQLAIVNPMKKNAWCNTITDTFSLALDDTIRHCHPPHANDKVDIQTLARLIISMDLLAENMADAPQEISTKLIEGKPINKLRTCMSTLCNAIAKYDKKAVIGGLSKEARKDLGGRLWSVDTNLMIVYSSEKTEWESGIMKVIELFSSK